MGFGGVEVVRGFVDVGAKCVDRSDDENVLVMVFREAGKVEAKETSVIWKSTDVSAPS